MEPRLNGRNVTFGQKWGQAMNW